MLDWCALPTLGDIHIVCPAGPCQVLGSPGGAASIVRTYSEMNGILVFASSVQLNNKSPLLFFSQHGELIKIGTIYEAAVRFSYLVRLFVNIIIELHSGRRGGQVSLIIF